MSRIAREGEGPWHGAFLIRVGDGLLVVNTSITGARLDRRVTLRIDDGKLPVDAAKSVLQDISRAQTTITIFGPDDRRQVCINLTQPQASRNSRSWWRRTTLWLIDVIVFVSPFSMISRPLAKVWRLLDAQGAERGELLKETRLILDSWITPSWISTVAEKDGREADWHTALGLIYYAYTFAAYELSLTELRQVNADMRTIPAETIDKDAITRIWARLSTAGPQSAELVSWYSAEMHEVLGGPVAL